MLEISIKFIEEKGIISIFSEKKKMMMMMALMLLVYYRLYITYNLAGFLFDLDQSNICRDIQKIEKLIRESLPIPQKIYNTTKRLKTPQQVEKYFPDFLFFIDCTEQQIPRPINKERKKEYYSGKKKKHTVKTQLMVNNRGFIVHKVGHKKGRRHDYDIYKENRPATPKEEVVNVFDLGYLGIEKDYSEPLSVLPHIERREIWSYLKKRQSITKTIPKRE